LFGSQALNTILCSDGIFQLLVAQFFLSSVATPSGFHPHTRAAKAQLPLLFHVR